MVKQRTAGCNTKGAQSGLFNETVLRPDGSTFLIVHEMEFDRPALTPLYIHLTATRTDSLSPVDVALIKSLLVARKFRIGENVKASLLYAIAYAAGNNFILSDLTISDDNVIFTDENIVSELDGKFTVITANITVTEVIPP